MTPDDPPKIARWLLEHLIRGERNEPLAGDLLEEFRGGRSSRWYWRQVLAAVMVGWMRGLRSKWLLVLFSFLWTVPAPAFWIYAIRWQESTFLTGRWHLNWPYSMICDITLTFSWQILYVWAGVVLGFSIFSVAIRHFDVRRLLRGICSSVAAYAFAFAGLLAWRVSFPMQFDIRHTTTFGVIINIAMVSFRVPFFVALLAGLLLAVPSTGYRRITAVR